MSKRRKSHKQRPASPQAEVQPELTEPPSAFRYKHRTAASAGLRMITRHPAATAYEMVFLDGTEGEDTRLFHSQGSAIRLCAKLLTCHVAPYQPAQGFAIYPFSELGSFRHYYPSEGGLSWNQADGPPANVGLMAATIVAMFYVSRGVAIWPSEALQWPSLAASEGTPPDVRLYEAGSRQAAIVTNEGQGFRTWAAFGAKGLAEAKQLALQSNVPGIVLASLRAREFEPETLEYIGHLLSAAFLAPPDLDAAKSVPAVAKPQHIGDTGTYL